MDGGRGRGSQHRCGSVVAANRVWQWRVRHREVCQQEQRRKEQQEQRRKEQQEQRQ